MNTIVELIVVQVLVVIYSFGWLGIDDMLVGCVWNIVHCTLL
ncbi:hypothetical protein [Candidatus Endolissoclinum faulkneri]|nr:hypothetical protein [Candidatus Endolissoclinum faulkneri]